MSEWLEAFQAFLRIPYVDVTLKVLLGLWLCYRAYRVSQRVRQREKYEGDTDKNGARHGHGKLVCKNGDVYEGNFVRGKFSGKGRYTYKNGCYYDGQWKRGKRHGEGEERYEGDILFRGEFRDDERHGKGSMQYPSRDRVYTGSWRNGRKHGQGEERTLKDDKPVFRGTYRRGVRHGRGVAFLADGTEQPGEWREGAFVAPKSKQA
ncbi:MAG: hypothetical protein MHM6MM_002271 [Cercozoa sp. M6MM]